MDFLETSLSDSFRIQGRVVFALFRRELLTRFGRHNIGFMWIFAEPMIFTCGVAALWAIMNIGHSGLPFVAFAITGYSSILVWRNTVNRCGMVIEANKALLFHRNVRAFDLYLARVMVEIVGATMSFLLLSIIFTSLGMVSLPENPLEIVGGWALLCWFGAALAFTLGGAGEFSEIVERLWHPAAYLIFPLSGAGFMVDWVPQDFRDVILWVPMVHGVEIVREGYFGSAVTAHYSVLYLVATNIFLTFIGLSVVRAVGKRVEL